MWACFCWVLKSWVFHVTLRTLPSCPGLTPTLHSTIGLIAGSATAPLLHQLEASQGGFLHFKESTFFNSVNTFINNNHMWCLFLIWWHLMILRWTGVTLCTLTIDIMWPLILSYKWLFMPLCFFLPPPPTIIWGPWIRDPQYEGKENILPQQFRFCAPGLQEVAIEWEVHPFSFGSHIFQKEKGEWES